jgi:hypothetical protein
LGTILPYMEKLLIVTTVSVVLTPVDQRPGMLLTPSLPGTAPFWPPRPAVSIGETMV